VGLWIFVQALHEALTGQHCGWRQALQSLDARFSDSKPLKGVHARPSILFVDGLDLLVIRSQSVRDFDISILRLNPWIGKFVFFLFFFF
jgi:hypothetical protein